MLLRRRSLIIVAILVFVAVGLALGARALVQWQRIVSIESACGTTLPADAEMISYGSFGYDEWGDHSSEIAFHASRNSLDEFAKKSFYGEWILDTSTQTWNLREYRRPGFFASGTIELIPGRANFAWGTH